MRLRNSVDHVGFDSPRGTDIAPNITYLDTGGPGIADLEKAIVRDHIRDYQQPNDPDFTKMLGVDQ